MVFFFEGMSKKFFFFFDPPADIDYDVCFRVLAGNGASFIGWRTSD